MVILRLLVPIWTGLILFICIQDFWCCSRHQGDPYPTYSIVAQVCFGVGAEELEGKQMGSDGVGDRKGRRRGRTMTHKSPHIIHRYCFHAQLCSRQIGCDNSYTFIFSNFLLFVDGELAHIHATSLHYTSGDHFPHPSLSIPQSFPYEHLTSSYSALVQLYARSGQLPT